MRDYWQFFRREAPLLTYGLLLTLLSSVGQTFLVSLFVPDFLATFPLDEGSFGLLYSGATLTSGLLLPWIGKWLDRKALHRFTLGVLALLAASAFTVAGAWHVAVLGAGLLGVRLGGQGLSSHTALTAMGRYYRSDRGKALSISNIGFSLGEAVLPLLLTGAIAWIGWRWTWVGLGAAVALAAPLVVALLGASGVELDPREAIRRRGEEGDGTAGDDLDADEPGSEPEPPAVGEATGDRGDVRHHTRRDVIVDPVFWCVVPAALLPAFWLTGFFLYQTGIAEAKGWSAALMASAFLSFALVRVAFTLGTGEWVDRLSARTIFPLTVLPMGLGIGLLWALDGVWVAYVFMALLGVTSGMNASVKTALWAELYGTEHLGAIKSMLASLMVISTSAAPPVVGFAMEGGGLSLLLGAGVGTVVLGALLALRALSRGAAAGRA